MLLKKGDISKNDKLLTHNNEGDKIEKNSFKKICLNQNIPNKKGKNINKVSIMDLNNNTSLIRNNNSINNKFILSKNNNLGSNFKKSFNNYVFKEKNSLSKLFEKQEKTFKYLLTETKNHYEEREGYTADNIGLP